MTNNQFSRVFFLLLGMVVYRTAWSAPATECAEKIAPGLTKLLSEKLPNLRVPQLIDLDRQSIDFDLSDGGDGCFAVASGDYAGHGNKDVAVLLVPIKGGAVGVALTKIN